MQSSFYSASSQGSLGFLVHSRSPAIVKAGCSIQRCLGVFLALDKIDAGSSARRKRENRSQVTTKYTVSAIDEVLYRVESSRVTSMVNGQCDEPTERDQMVYKID